MDELKIEGVAADKNYIFFLFYNIIFNNSNTIYIKNLKQKYSIN